MSSEDRLTCRTCRYKDRSIDEDPCRPCVWNEEENTFSLWTPPGVYDPVVPSEAPYSDDTPPEAPTPPSARPSLPDDAQARLEYPMADGLLDYFPNALAEVARLSHKATQQHHPEEGMHWDRSKSLDHRNKIMRHLVDTGKVDDKGMRHSAMVAWRSLALLQEELEAAEGLPPSRASRNAPTA